MLTTKRFDAEINVLLNKGYTFNLEPSKFPPEKIRFNVKIKIGSNTDFYNIVIHNLNLFPEKEPIVTVTRQFQMCPLIDCWGREMKGPSRENHLLSSHKGLTHICLFSSWNPLTSIYKILSRYIFWLHAYQRHLLERHPIDYYISHQQ